MKYDYKRVELKTKKDFKKAERLKDRGWKIISVGFINVILEKERR